MAEEEKQKQKHAFCTGEKCIVCHPDFSHRGYQEEIKRNKEKGE